MKKIFGFSEVFMFLIFINLVCKNSHTEVYKVDTNLSTLEWSGEKITKKHTGTIKFSKGEIKNDHGKISGSFEIDMNTITNTDIKSAEGRTKLESHLKSGDFFHVDKYPVSKFVIKSVSPLNYIQPGPYTHNVTGLLTIKDKTNEISFDANISMQENKFVCTGTAIIDRSKFDVKHQSKTFFPDIGDRVIYDNFDLKFNVIAIK